MESERGNNVEKEEKTKNIDKDLKKALSDGDFISISSPVFQSFPKFEDESLPIKSDISFFQYNPPIGIDFSKTFPPIPYIISIELLNLLVNIPQVTTELRYQVDNLHSLLTQGKISEYKRQLTVIVSESENKKTKNRNSDKLDFQDSYENVMINALGFFLAHYANINSDILSSQPVPQIQKGTTNQVPKKWLNPQTVLDYSESIEAIKKQIKVSQEEIKFNATDAYQLLLISFFVKQIEAKLPNPPSTAGWINLKKHLYNQDWKRMSAEIASQISLQSSTADQHINNAFIYQMLFLLHEILQNPVK